jgi:hypothetical protein
MTRMILLLVWLCTVSTLVFADEPMPNDPWRFRAGLRNSLSKRQLNQTQLRLVAESLRQKTGWLELGFDEAGFLTLGDRTHVAGGSATARELLQATVDGRQAFELEVHNRSAAVEFANLSAGIVYQSQQTNRRIAVKQIRLDLADFAELRGNHEVLATFDVGFAVLHELVHGALGLRDAVGATQQLGACDALVNHIRRELGLPERLGYAARVHRELFGAGATGWAELVFGLVKKDRLEPKRLYLRWEAKRVANLATATPSARLQYR